MPPVDELGTVVIDGMVPAPLEAPREPFMAGMAPPGAPVEPFIAGMVPPPCAEGTLGIDDIDPDGVAEWPRELIEDIPVRDTAAPAWRASVLEAPDNIAAPIIVIAAMGIEAMRVERRPIGAPERAATGINTTRPAVSSTPVVIRPTGSGVSQPFKT
jgi:hypothetical protein